MWTCEADGCGCKNIAADLAACPMCGKEQAMPKATSGGASSAWEDTEADAVPEAELPVEAAEVPADAETVTGAEPDAGSAQTDAETSSAEEPPAGPGRKVAKKAATAAQAASGPEAAAAGAEESA